MPPRTDEQFYNTITYANGTTYDARTYYDTIDATIANLNEQTVGYDFEQIHIVTKKELDEFCKNLAKKIYEVISNNTKINISEEEFMSILKEEG